MSIKPDSFANSLGKETALEKRDLLTNSDFFFSWLIGVQNYVQGDFSSWPTIFFLGINIQDAILIDSFAVWVCSDSRPKNSGFCDLAKTM